MPSVADRLRAILEPLPVGAAVTLPADVVRAWLEDEPATATPAPAAVTERQTWRERLWSCPSETRLGVRELAEAMGRPHAEAPGESAKSKRRKRVPGSDWVYRAVDPKWSAERGREPLPCSRLDGVLVFTAGAVRHWLHASESVVNPEPAASRLRVTRAGRAG